MSRWCDKALDSAGEVCPVCFRVHEPRPQPAPEAPELTYADYGSAKNYAAGQTTVCAHADDDSIGAHVLAPGEKCDRGKP